ncbi:hypothetical protein BC826DRAFT_1174191 [Russula brevipes]|nr:hypothetical protein BC826DRAFT_1174191 [Russula brevipes]
MDVSARVDLVYAKWTKILGALDVQLMVHWGAARARQLGSLKLSGQKNGNAQWDVLKRWRASYDRRTAQVMVHKYSTGDGARAHVSQSARESSPYKANTSTPTQVYHCKHRLKREEREEQSKKRKGRKSGWEGAREGMDVGATKSAETRERTVANLLPVWALWGPMSEPANVSSAPRGLAAQLPQPESRVQAEAGRGQKGLGETFLRLGAKGGRRSCLRAWALSALSV